MRPEIAELLQNVGCAPAPRPTEQQRLAVIVSYCSRLIGYIQCHGITPRVPHHGRDIAKLAERDLPPRLAAGFAPLARLDETLAECPRWNHSDLSAHISSIAREAVLRSAS
ncbi:MAG: hypothetical protein AAFY12_11690 [Pseudomonadota bacterium]